MANIPKPSDIRFPKLEINKIKNARTCLTFRKGFDSRALKGELLQAGEISEAFGHQISKIRNTKCEVNRDVLSGRLSSFLQCPMSRFLRLANIPKPSGIIFPKLETKNVKSIGTYFRGAAPASHTAAG